MLSGAIASTSTPSAHGLVDNTTASSPNAWRTRFSASREVRPVKRLTFIQQSKRGVVIVETDCSGLAAGLKVDKRGERHAVPDGSRQRGFSGDQGEAHSARRWQLRAFV